MRINNLDLSSLNAKQWNVTIGNVEIKENTVWPAGSLVPVFIPPSYGFKPLKVTILVKGNGRNDISSKCSTIIGHAMGVIDSGSSGDVYTSLDNVVNIRLDSRPNDIFYATLVKHSVDETVPERWHKLTLEFKAMHIAGVKTITLDQDVYKYEGGLIIGAVVENESSLPSPCNVFLLNAKKDIDEAYIWGVCRRPFNYKHQEVYVRNIKKGEDIFLMGLDTAGSNSTSIKAELWEPTVLMPGMNQIFFSVPDAFEKIDVRLFPLQA